MHQIEPCGAVLSALCLSELLLGVVAPRSGYTCMCLSELLLGVVAPRSGYTCMYVPE